MIRVVQGRLYQFAFAVLLVSLGACGFQPRGSAALPAAMAITYIDSVAPHATLRDDFAEALMARGGRVTRERAEATAVVHLLSDNLERRLLSIDTDGKALEYELRQTLRFSVSGAARTLLQEQEVSMAKSYLHINTDVLGKQREDGALRRSLQRDLIDLALLRITAAAR